MRRVTVNKYLSVLSKSLKSLLGGGGDNQREPCEGHRNTGMVYSCAFLYKRFEERGYEEGILQACNYELQFKKKNTELVMQRRRKLVAQAGDARCINSLRRARVGYR